MDSLQHLSDETNSSQISFAVTVLLAGPTARRQERVPPDGFGSAGFLFCFLGKKLAVAVSFEPATSRLTGSCPTTALRALSWLMFERFLLVEFLHEN